MNMGCFRTIFRLKSQDSQSKVVLEPNPIAPPCTPVSPDPSGVAQDPLLVPIVEPLIRDDALLAEQAVPIQTPAGGQPVIVTSEETEGEDVTTTCHHRHHKKKKPCGYKICGCFQCIIDKFPIPCRICWYFWCPCCIPCPMRTEQQLDGESNVNVTAEAVINVTAVPATGISDEPTVEHTAEHIIEPIVVEPVASTTDGSWAPTSLIIPDIRVDALGEPLLVTTPAVSTTTAWTTP